MDNSDTLLYALGRIVGSLAQIIVIAACVILVIKRRNAASILMLIGSILSLVFSVVSFSGTLISANQGSEQLLQWTKISAVIGPLPYFLFAVGIILYAINHVRKESSDS